MGYNKTIIYGNIIESYQYTEQLRVAGRRYRGSSQHPQNEDVLSGLAQDRQNVVVQEKQEGLRRKDNARRTKLEFTRFVSSNFSELENPQLFTITYEANMVDLSIGYRDFKSFIRIMRSVFGKSFRYIAVPEFQERGAVHFHALFWGLPASVYKTERRSRRIRAMWGRGHVYIKKTDGSIKLAYYLGKYMSKAFEDSRLFNQKSFVASRNCLRPLVYKGIPFSFIYEDYELSTCPILDSKQYMTQWLGRGNYYKYLTPKINENRKV